MCDDRAFHIKSTLRSQEKCGYPKNKINGDTGAARGGLGNQPPPPPPFQSTDLKKIIKQQNPRLKYYLTCIAFLYLVAYLSSFHDKAILTLYKLAYRSCQPLVYHTKIGESR